MRNMKMTFGMTVLFLMTLGAAECVVAQQGSSVGSGGQAVERAPQETAPKFLPLPVSDTVPMVAAEPARVEAGGSSAEVKPGAGADARPNDSHIRIVRLSDVRGHVGLDRNTGRGIEPTMQNMPIVEGGKLETDEGMAEVEFEDDSTLRVAPNSVIEFPLLVLRASGGKASTVKIRPVAGSTRSRP